MGMPAALTPDWTVEMVHALPDDGKRYEVVDGELLVTPAPFAPHQNAVLELAVLLKAYAESVGLHVLVAPFAVMYSARTEVQPDLLVLPRPRDRRLQRFEDVGRLELAVEVLSPSSLRADRYVKRRLYQRMQVPEYWIVDTGSQLVERWRPNDELPEVLLTSLEWRPVPEQQPLTVDLGAYFAAVLR